MRLLNAVIIVIFFILVLILAINNSLSIIKLGGEQETCKFPDYVLSGGHDYELFEIMPGDVSKYSSLMPWHIEDLNRALRAEVDGGKIKILDATAHIGADSVNFLKLYPRSTVTSVEINPDVAIVLKRNMRTFISRLGLKPSQSKVVVGDARDHIVKADIVYFDPPWLGARDIPRLGDEPLAKYVKLAAMRGARVIFVKVPREANYAQFIDDVGISAHTYDIKNSKSGKLSYWLIAFRP